MDERRALMAAIIANPDEDTPRLALADWLQEHGDKPDQARAEFIRLQIEEANAPPGKRRGEVEKKAKALAKKHRKKWLAPLGLLSSIWVDYGILDFDRGLVDWLTVEPGEFFSKRWQAMLPDALAAVGVEELSFYSPTKRTAKLAESTAIRWVARLDYPEADDAALAAFARSENFAHLSELRLGDVRITDAGLRDFAKCTRTARLRSLEVSNRGALSNTRPKFTAKGVLALLASDQLPLLKSLDIGGLTGVHFGLRGFLSNPALANLERLGLEMEGDAADVVANPHFAALRALRLHEFWMTDSDAEALLSRQKFPKLEELNLYVQRELAPPVESKLKKRFGDRLELSYIEEG